MNRTLLNLTMHGIGVPPAAISDGELAVWLSESSFNELLDTICGRDDVRLTFDDGNESDATIALPALLDRGMTAEFFVCAGRIDSPGYLSARQISALVDSGMSIGSHGMNHRPWRGLSRKELQAEIVEARKVIEQTSGSPIVHAACPFGAYDRRSLSALRDAGFDLVYTSDGGRTSNDAWLQPRNTLPRVESAAALHSLLETQPRGRQLVRNVKGLIKQWR